VKQGIAGATTTGRSPRGATAKADSPNRHFETPHGDPAKLAKALVTIVAEKQPPLRWVAGADAVATVEQKANELLAQVAAYRDLSSSLAIDEPELAESAR
jgi:hypothetical protein